MFGDECIDLDAQLTALVRDNACLVQELERIAHELAVEIAQRKQFESDLRNLAAQIERGVQKRTVELVAERDTVARAAVRAILAASEFSRILLVEDNEINRIVAFGLLEELGIHAEWAGNGQEALGKLAMAPYDLVLMDLQMPVMDGLSATRAIRSDPRWNALPIIAMSANAAHEDRSACLAAGMNGFISKPVEPAQLWIALATFLAPKARTTTDLGSKAARPADASTAQDGFADSASITSVIPPPQPVFSDRSRDALASATRTSSPAGSGSWSSARGASPGSTTFHAGAFPGKSSGVHDTFPDTIEGVDIADGLGRLLGNRNAYFSLLRKFVDRGRGSAATLRSLLVANDIESAIREAHSVKGVAAGLGIKGIASQAATVEAAIRRRDSPEALSPCIAEYERLLAEVLIAISAGLGLA